MHSYRTEVLVIEPGFHMFLRGVSSPLTTENGKGINPNEADRLDRARHIEYLWRISGCSQT